MKILKAPYHFAILSYLDYTPRVFRRQVKGRAHSSFLYISRGSYEYTFSGDSFTAQSNALVYLPQGADYHYAVLNRYAKCYQIELDIITENNKRMIFSDAPQIVGYYPDEKMKQLFENIKSAADDALSGGIAMCAVYDLIFSVLKQTSNSGQNQSKILPAVEYIQTHYNENFSMRTLADLCFLSESQMRRIFRAEYNCSPLAYKNNLIFDLAKKMLNISNYAVSDIADTLGFQSVYAFSRFFKKRQGICPSEFRKKSGKHEK